ncbi:MAG: O-antigen ligase family protein, partial [Paracoccaceae bacterium]
AIAVFSTLLAGFGIIAAWSGVNPILQEDASATVSASFINRNSYATYAIFGVIANLAIYLHLTTGLESSGDLRMRGLRDFLESFFSGVWIFALGLLLCLAAVVLTQSRAGGVSGLLALLTFGVAYRFRGDRLNPILLAMLAAILGFVALSLASGVTERLLATGGEESRFQIYSLIVQGIAERPLLGHGLGAFQDTFRAFVPLGQASAEWELAHSSYLENAYELGLPAAAAFYLALGWVAAVIARGCLTRRHHRSFACVALACIVAGAFHSVFDFSLQMPASAALFAAILGIGWTQAFSRESRRRGSRRGTE